MSSKPKVSFKVHIQIFYFILHWMCLIEFDGKVFVWNTVHHFHGPKSPWTILSCHTVLVVWKSRSIRTTKSCHTPGKNKCCVIHVTIKGGFFFANLEIAASTTSFYTYINDKAYKLWFHHNQPTPPTTIFMMLQVCEGWLVLFIWPEKFLRCLHNYE